MDAWRHLCPYKHGYRRMIDVGCDVWKHLVRFEILAEAAKMKGHDSHDERDQLLHS